jgi:hypothetical protein
MTPPITGLRALLDARPTPARVEVHAGGVAPTTAQLTDGGRTYEIGVHAGELWCRACGATVAATPTAIRGHRCGGER